MNAFLFLWNPSKDTASFRDYDQVCRDAERGRSYETRWICPSRQPQAGDLVFIQRTGSMHNGVFARGRIARAPFEHRGTQYVQLSLDAFLPIGSEIPRPRIIATAEYHRSWAPMASGNRLPDPLLTAIETLWKKATRPNVPVVESVRTVPADGPTMSTALFINGIYDGVCAEILAAQEAQGGGESFLQPYASQVIKMLKRRNPKPEDPIRLYVSTTANLSQICYTAEIVRWEDKRELSDLRRQEVHDYLARFQSKEVDLFIGAQKAGEKGINLVSIRSLHRLAHPFPTSLLRKVSDGLPLQKRTRSGGWSEVHDLGDVIQLPTETQERFESTLAAEVKKSRTLTDDELQARLAAAGRLPQRVQVISVGYRRNPDVIVAVLRRAEGVCEKCRKDAPFLRRSDGSPFLEVHHRLSLSQGGEDSVENALALCPNCHREIHHGGPIT
jgi:5-methylcytosine-specific restriction protein A